MPEILSTMPASSIIGNSLCGKPLLIRNGSSNSNKFSVEGIAGIVMGCLCPKRRMKLKQQVEEPALAVAKNESSEAKVSKLDMKKLEFLRLSARMLGYGTFGTTFKTTLGNPLAVKRLRDFNVSEKEFEDVVDSIGKITHPNLVPLNAYYYSEELKFLVYEFIPKGSLSALLHGKRGGGRRTPLNWETRTRIAIGAARAIAHIHSINPSTTHGNIKSSIIFLTPTSEVRVSEFGLANVVGPTCIEGGYRAPEVTDANIVSQKADVYSFGVLLLELLSGKDPNESRLKDEGMDLPRWMLSAVNDEWTSEVFDIELLQYENVEEVMLQACSS